MSDFKYGPLNACDQARVAQQNGHIPPQHVFQPRPYAAVPDQTDPNMCGFSECFAPPSATWHTDG